MFPVTKPTQLLAGGGGGGGGGRGCGGGGGEGVILDDTLVKGQRVWLSRNDYAHVLVTLGDLRTDMTALDVLLARDR